MKEIVINFKEVKGNDFPKNRLLLVKDENENYFTALYNNRDKKWVGYDTVSFKTPIEWAEIPKELKKTIFG